MKSSLKNILSILIVVCLFIGLVPVALAAGEYDGKTVVLYTGNLRGDVDQLPKIAAAKTTYETAGADVILVDAGNFLQGTQYSANGGGRAIIDLMSKTGYDVLSLGRYDFAFGTGTLGTSYHGDASELGSLGNYFDSTHAKFVASNTMKLVSANISGENNNFYGFAASETVDTGPVTIGLFGLTDPDTVNNTPESNLSGMSFDAAASAASAQAAVLSSCDVVIGLSNAGVASIAGATMVDIPASAGFTVGALVIDNTEKTVTTETVTLGADDATVASAVSALKALVNTAYGSSVATSTVTLNGSSVATKSGETNLGDLWTDALRWYATSGNITSNFSGDYRYDSIQVDNDHVVAIWNAGNLRDYINTGAVTITDVYRALPYPNSVALIYVTGAELLEQLEACSQGLPYSAATNDHCNSVMQVSGIVYNVDISKDYDAGDQYGTSRWYKAADGNANGRVTITSINGKPFRATDTY